MPCYVCKMNLCYLAINIFSLSFIVIVTIRDGTWNVLNMQHTSLAVAPEKGPPHTTEGGHHRPQPTTRNSPISMVTMAWISNYSHIKWWDVVTHSIHNSNLFQPNVLNSGQGWVITSMETMYIFIYAYPQILVNTLRSIQNGHHFSKVTFLNGDLVFSFKFHWSVFLGL